MADPLYAGGGGSVAPRGLDRLVHLLLPAPCLGCGAPLPARGAPLGLCAPCRGRLRPLGDAGCAVCGVTGAVAPGERCAACRAVPPAFERLLAAWSYAPPLDGVIAGLKFRRLDYLGRHLAAGVVEVLGGGLGGFDAVVAVPLHWRRRLARGYDQAERIARPLAGLAGAPFVAALRRRRPTPPQTSLGRAERLANLGGLERAFALRRGVTAAIVGRRLLLVDDVATTGATLSAAAAALRAAGAAAVTAVVAGRTPVGGGPAARGRS